MEILCSPNTNDVETYIEERNNLGIKTNKILHIVPTMILFKRRAKFYRDVLKRNNIYLPKFQTLSDRKVSDYLIEQGIYLFELNRFFQYLIEKVHPSKVLKRREALILIERVLQNSPNTNHFVWNATVSDIYDFFQLISISGIDLSDIELTLTESYEQLLVVYKMYLEELKKLGCIDFGLASREIVYLNDFSNFNEIYFDGAFLPIQPSLHQLLMQIKKTSVGNMKFFIPFDMDQHDNPVFRVLKKTYLPYVPYEKWKSIKSHYGNHNVVEKLARSIFTDNKIKVDDTSFQIVEFETMEEEFSSILKRIAEYIKKGIVKEQKIAIITPKPMELRPYVRELAELYGLKCDVPERPLIHLPLGKFLFLLYDIHINNKINYLDGRKHYINYEMMSEFFYLDIIVNSEKIFKIYKQLKAFFVDCITFDDWFTQINCLNKAKEKITSQYKYHPLYLITKEELFLLKDYFSKIKYLSEKLFNTGNHSFVKHLEVLFNKLEEEKSILKIDDDSRERIRNILDSSERNNNILINVKEFATKIQSLLKDDKREDEEESSDTTKIIVTGPNNVEFQEYQYIFLTRFTQNMYPEVVNYKWPLNLDLEFKLLKSSTLLSFTSSRELFQYYLDRALYYLFVVLNSAKKKLTITYSKKDNGIKQSVSHYLHDIAFVFGIEEGVDSKVKLEDLLRECDLLKNATSNKVNYIVPSTKQDYQLIQEETVLTIEDLAVYEYCPRRFYYEKKYPEKKVYTDIFHIMNYGAACVYEEAIKLLIKRYPIVNRSNKRIILLTLNQILKEVREEMYVLFPLGFRYWEDINLRTRFHIESLINFILENTDHNSAEISIGGQNVEKVIGGYTFKGERALEVKYPTITHYYPISNLKSLLSFSVNVKEKEEKDYLDNIKKEYQELLRGFCYKKESTMKKLENYAEKISNQEFDKNPGGHCVYCTFKDVCMEKEIINHATD